MKCQRCGSAKKIEKHHIVQRIHNGSDEDDNLQELCRACHKYEHTLRALEASLEFEKWRGQADRIACYQHRIDVLNELNTPALIAERGTYLSYWTNRPTRYLPRRMPTKGEAKFEKQFNQLLAEKQMVMELRV